MDVRRLGRSVAPLLGVLLFAVALWVLHGALRAHHFRDIVQTLRAMPPRRVLLAFLATAFSYVVMTGYDALALAYIKRPIRYARTALASFVGYAFSNNIGLSMLAGASVRYHLYSAWGLSTLEITKLVFFCSATFWTGFLALGGLLFLFHPPPLPAWLPLALTSSHAVGVLFLLLVGAYLGFCLRRSPPLLIRGMVFEVPPFRLALLQVAVAGLDWLVAAAALYALLPAARGLTFSAFVGMYLAAQLSGLVSQVPGGLGVFESVLLLSLAPMVPATEALAALLAFRGMYYLLPLLAAACALALREGLRRRGEVARITGLVGPWAPHVVPRLLAATTFAGGVILLFSGATPTDGSRLEWLGHILPLPVLEVSHFLGSVMGGGLLLLATALWRRIDAAYLLTLVTLGVGSLVALLKGMGYEEALILAIMFAALAPCRACFYRRSALITRRFSLGWTLGILLVLLSTTWLLFFAYRHLDYSHDLWWHFTLYGDAPRSLRSLAGAVTLILFVSLAKLVRPRPARREPESGSLDGVNAVVRQSPATYANLALLGDKSFLFSPSGESFLMYRIAGRSWITMGDPVGNEAEWRELAWSFREEADRYGGWTVFYQVSEERLSLYVDLGLTLLRLGEEGRVRLDSFSLDGGSRKALRHTVSRLQREGCTFSVVPPEEVVLLLPELRAVSDAWLRAKRTAEKQFSLGCFRDDYVSRFPAALVRKDGRIVGFATVWCGAGHDEVSPDLMRYTSAAPADLMEYLFIQLMLWGREQGFRWFNLGMAPLSGLEERALAPQWNRLGNFVYRHAEHFYNFKGLRHYKEKFRPEWRGKYLACPGGLALPRVLSSLATLISGGTAKVFRK